MPTTFVRRVKQQSRTEASNPAYADNASSVPQCCFSRAAADINSTRERFTILSYNLFHLFLSWNFSPKSWCVTPSRFAAAGGGGQKEKENKKERKGETGDVFEAIDVNAWYKLLLITAPTNPVWWCCRNVWSLEHNRCLIKVHDAFLKGASVEQ